MNHEPLLQNAQRSPFDIVVRFFLGLVEFAASLFSLPAELIMRRSIGRRYFSLIGLIGIYCIWTVVFAFVWLFSDWQGMPTITIGLTGSGHSPEVEAARRIYEAQSQAGLSIFLRVFLMLGVCHKAAMMWRKIHHTEPNITTYGGQCWLEPLLFQRVAYLGLDRLMRTPEDAVKLVLEPGCVYLAGKYIVGPFVNAGIGTALVVSAVAMAVRASLIIRRNMESIDDVADLQAIWAQRLSFIGPQAQEQNGVLQAVPVMTPRRGD